MPIRRRRCARARRVNRAVSWPAIVIRPEVGSSMAAISRSSVLLPAPEGPTTSTSSPRATLRLRSERTSLKVPRRTSTWSSFSSVWDSPGSDTSVRPSPPTMRQRCGRRQARPRIVRPADPGQFMERTESNSLATSRRTHRNGAERAVEAQLAPIARLLDRELSHLAFNERVLALTQRTSVPLAERLRYVCIVSSNLDEFFEIRISELMGEMRETGGINQASPLWESFAHIAERAHGLVDRQYQIYNEQIIPALARERIVVLSHSKRTPAQRAWVKEYFEGEVRPLLSPIGLDPAHPFPQVMNKTLNFIVQLNGKDAFGRPGTIAIVKVPRALPRVIPLPSRLTPNRQAFVLLSSVIRAHLADLFPRRGVAGFSQFRVTRDSELWVDEREVSDLRHALQVELTQRHFGNAVRLEVLRTCPEALELMLREQFELPPHAVYRVAGPVNLVRLNQLVDHLNRPEHRFPPLVPAWPRQLAQGSDLFEAIRQGDILLHHPFESFEPVVDFLRQAVADPKVVAIRMTLHQRNLAAIANEARLARAGKPARVIAKVNALVDEATINALYEASGAGVRIDLIVRGACSLRPGVKGLSENIQVRSVVGRFLEHHRIYYYGAGGSELVYLASADWMGRNLFRRIEVAFPVLDPKLKRRVIEEGLRPYLEDTAEAWTLLPAGEYAPPRQLAHGQCAQRKLLALLTRPDEEP